MRTVIIPLIVGVASCSIPPSPTNVEAAGPASGGEVITVQLSNFAFDPDEIRLKAGVPVRLRLVNASDGGHNFSAPSFFATTRFPPSSSLPLNGTVEVPPHQTIEMAVVPQVQGRYPLQCTHFLHSTFGMHGTIEVVP
jgi:plastocyanin